MARGKTKPTTRFLGKNDKHHGREVLVERLDFSLRVPAVLENEVRSQLDLCPKKELGFFIVKLSGIVRADPSVEIMRDMTKRLKVQPEGERLQYIMDVASELKKGPALSNECKRLLGLLKAEKELAQKN